MDRRVILIIFLMWQMHCLSQVEILMHNLTGKSIDFKNRSETIVADYGTDTTTFSTKTNETIDLATFNCGYYKQDFVKTKVDLYATSKDTLLYTYGFFKDRLFEIHIYSNNDSINRILAKNLGSYFNLSLAGPIQGMQAGHITRHKTVKKAHMYSNYKYNKIDKRNSIYIILTYAPIHKYLPLWCGFGKRPNWEVKLEKKLSGK